MTGTDLVERTQGIVQTIDSPAFQERVEALLPDTVPYRRFVQIAKTAVRANPDLAEAEQTSLFGALVRCAQDGLYPDGREAALAVYNTKVGDSWVKKAQYLPMIGGLRKRLAEYGWTLKTRVVYSNDEFDYSEEPQQIRHVPVRPGVDRGARVAAYAVATHRDGRRRLQIVLHAADVEKRKAKTKSDKVWKEWPDAMWEKSAGHAIFDEIPQAERDRMTLPTDNNVESAVEFLYGPDGHEFPVTRTGGDVAAVSPAGTEPPAASGEASGTGGDGQQEAASSALSEPGEAASPDTDDPEPAPAVEETDPAAVVVPLERSPWRGKTLAEVSESEEGREWLAWALRNEAKLPADFYAQLVVFVESKLAAEREAA